MRKKVFEYIPNSFEEIFNYRHFFMGCAIIWIVLFHSGVSLKWSILQKIKEIGYGGVDIFLFCSGFGCSCSYLKCQDILCFIKKRIARIFPTWLIFMCVWIPCQFLIGMMTPFAILGNILCIQKFTGLGMEFNWYMSAILLFYLFIPYFVEICKKLTFYKNIWMLLLLFSISIVFWNSNDFIMTACRFPIFYLGVMVANFKNKIFNKKTLSYMYIGLILGFLILLLCIRYSGKALWYCGLYWYPFILIVPGLCHLLSIIVVCISNYKLGEYMINVIANIGKYSFNIYLIHILVFQIASYLNQSNYISLNNMSWGVIFIFAFIFSYLFGKIVSTVKIGIYLFFRNYKSSNP